MTIYTLDGHAPQIAENTWIAPDANVIGKVVIEDLASIWFGCTLRGDNEEIRVGAGSNVQENCVLHTDMGYPLLIGPGCTIGHKAMLHGCILEENVLIGMGATVLNGARIGRNSLIGAGALITEGKEIPEGSLVMGAPGRVVRSLDAAAIAALRATALHYQQNLRRYRTGLTAL
ncbi:gamma carbonic anhydrase family protein [Roseovarius sp. BRH_c41]|jgi:carbonic anhydrase/acetyltransferase-like protein (isoleucine patch superfamily)|uniref:gamma carbonic anhydrase family protein n=1 Tax=Roseovarius sp. BRH_c41 TaxID=1629709 RepID=UPI0005F0F3AD|nr:gamma carbonic anhydrase family protein [Roseovarius sp. BRH_c41]KJS42061.1 MAG: anhydrase [Roseovarius sp. BRH_c41]